MLHRGDRRTLTTIQVLETQVLASQTSALPRYSCIWFDRRAGCLGSVNSSSSMGAPFSTMNATRTPADGLFGGIRISRPVSSEERSVTSNATWGTRRTRSGNRGVRFEAHPLHAEFAFLVADHKDFQVFQVRLPRLRLGSGNSDVMVPAHCFPLSVELAQVLRYRYRVGNRALVAGLLRHEVNCTSLVLPQVRFGMDDALNGG